MNEKINVKCKKMKRTTPNTYILKKLYQPIEFKAKHKVSKENFNVLKIGEYEKALIDYNAAIAINPSYQNAINNRKILLESGVLVKD